MAVEPSTVRLAERPDRCLVPASRVHHDAAGLFADAVAATVAGDEDTARAVLGRIHDAPFRDRWVAAGWEWKWRHRPTQHRIFDGDKAPAYIPAGTLRYIQDRDGWRCRFCDLRLVDWRVLKELCVRFPDELSWGTQDVDQHAAVAGLRFSPEHVFPRSRGGSNDPDNLVSACWTCQFQKGECTLEELWLDDPRNRAPVTGDWDGLKTTFDRLRR